MAINIDVILEQTGETKEEFAQAVHIPLEKLDAYISGKEKPSIEVYGIITDYTGLTYEQIEEGKKRKTYAEFDISDTWSPSEEAKQSLERYLIEGSNSFDETIVLKEIEKVKIALNNWRKPRISFAGQSDTGKSTLINALLGAERMPAKWTPTTSIVVYIKHTNDRPSFIKDNVCIFRKIDDVMWSDSYLNNEEEFNRFLITSGDYSLLENYGTHQGVKNSKKEAYSAVAFIESKLLEDCDIIDLPGFAASEEDDALHKFNTQDGMTDILIYLSRSNGFLQDRDLDYLNICINSLRCVESNDNEIENLENLFIIATQSGAIHGGNARELNTILETQCNKLCSILRHSIEKTKGVNSVESLLPARTRVSGRNYTDEDFRRRFFTYETDLPRLCKKFIGAFTKLIERLPLVIHRTFVVELEKIAKSSETSIKVKINEYKKMVQEKEKYISLVREIEEAEPGRKAEQTAKREAVISKIKTLGGDAKREYQEFLTEYLSEDNLINEMRKAGISNKKSEKQDFVSLVGKVTIDKAQDILEEKAKKYTEIIDEYIFDFCGNVSSYGMGEGINVKFDGSGAFSLGLQAILATGVLGASALWLTTNAISIIVLTEGLLAPTAWIAAVGGVAFLAITAAIAGLTAIIKAITWRGSLAKSIIKSYEEKEFAEGMMAHFDKYWSDTETSFLAGADAMEKEWEEQICEYKMLADEKNVEIFANKIKELNRGLGFFEQMPLPETT